MTINEVVQFVDRLVLEQTGKHLDDLQKAVIEGTWQRKTYENIAQECHATKNHVGDVGYELWQLLSEQLGEDINKLNFRSAIERLSSNESAVIIQTNNKSNNSFNVCNYPYQNIQKSKENIQKSIYHELTLAPQIINFHGRENELSTLSDWLLNQNTRLISVLGLAGIGKTSLVKRFIDLNLQQFEIIYWSSLKFPKPLNLLLNNLLQTCQQEAKEAIDDKLKQILEILKEKKCLIVFDDLQNIFISGELAGQYQAEYQNYQNLLKILVEAEHQSNIILISQEQCSEMQCLDEELYPIKYLDLSGLDNTDFIKNIISKDEESWLKLIRLYEGNPLYLKDIIILIKDIFDNSVTEFLAENNLMITSKMRSHFNQLFNKLFLVEQKIILELAKFDQPVSKEDLKRNLDLSSIDFINGLKSLQQRYLVTQVKNNKSLFKLSPVFREYIKNSY